jgi:hypothetical protein
VVKRKAYYPDGQGGQGLHFTCPSFPAHDHNLLIFFGLEYIFYSQIHTYLYTWVVKK